MGIAVNQDGTRRSAMQLLAFPDVDFSLVSKLKGSFAEISEEIASQLAREALYMNYIERQKKDIALLQKDEQHKIPDGFEYEGLQGLSNELKSKLIAARPSSLAQAGRIDGMTPAAMTLILAKIRQSRKRKSA